VTAMPFSDDELLDFDASEIADWIPGTKRRLLTEQPELYRSHLAIARSVRRWSSRLAGGFEETQYGKGYTRAVQDVAAHLRRGSFLPGGDIFSGS
jgi:hypothetical protein